ncbi:MAG: ParB/RepB/Spo0J family partition protein [Verrucomicrobiota bacterium]
MAVKRALGKGLGALIGPAPSSAMTSEHPVANPAIPPMEDADAEMVQEAPIQQITTSPHQPRKDFSPEELQELADSIRSLGILQPLLVRQVGGHYELIAGERRWRAAQMAGLEKVPVIIRQASDLEVFEWAMVENLQRADLNPIEEAEGYATLIEKFALSQEEIARRVGKNRATVANSLRLRNLSPNVQDLVRKNHLSVGHAKAILSITEEKTQEAAAAQVIKKSLSVRQTERLVSTLLGERKRRKRAITIASSADWRDLELKLQRIVGTRVRLVGTAEKGRIEIEFYNPGELDRILSHLGMTSEE